MDFGIYVKWRKIRFELRLSNILRNQLRYMDFFYEIYFFMYIYGFQLTYINNCLKTYNLKTQIDLKTKRSTRQLKRKKSICLYKSKLNRSHDFFESTRWTS